MDVLYQPVHPDLEQIAQFMNTYQRLTEPLKAIGDPERAKKWIEIIEAFEAYRQFIKASLQNPTLQQYIQNLPQVVYIIRDGLRELYHTDMTKLEQAIQQDVSTIKDSEKARKQTAVF